MKYELVYQVLEHPKQQISGNKRLYAVAAVAVTLVLIQGIPTAYASTDFERLGRDIDGAVSAYEQGNQDGIAQGAADYREGYSFNSECSSGGIAYCAGYILGYGDGWSSARKVG